MSARHLDLAVDLDCNLDGDPVRIFAVGRKVVVEAKSLHVLRKAASLAPVEKSLRRRARSLKRLLDSTGIRVEGRVDGKMIGCIGHGVGSRFWCFFGLPAMQLKPYAIIAAMSGNQSRG